jgi:hypothetical protein
MKIKPNRMVSIVLSAVLFFQLCDGPTLAQDINKVDFEWTSSASITDVAIKSLKPTSPGLDVKPLYAEIRSDGKKAGPAILLIAGAVVIDLLVNTIIKITREKKNGSFITVCNGKTTIQTSPTFPADTVIIHDCSSGKTQSFSGVSLNSSTTETALKAIITAGKKG